LAPITSRILRVAGPAIALSGPLNCTDQSCRGFLIPLPGMWACGSGPASRIDPLMGFVDRPGGSADSPGPGECPSAYCGQARLSVPAVFPLDRNTCMRLLRRRCDVH
jgi:hypothetical protein